jgi:hypothetical protein
MIADFPGRAKFDLLDSRAGRGYTQAAKGSGVVESGKPGVSRVLT